MVLVEHHLPPHHPQLALLVDQQPRQRKTQPPVANLASGQPLENHKK